MNRTLAAVGGALVIGAVVAGVLVSDSDSPTLVAQVVATNTPRPCDASEYDHNHDCAINSIDQGLQGQHFGTMIPTWTFTPTPVPTATNTPTGNNPTPNDPQYSTQWPLAKIRAPLAWEFGHGSASIKVALLDTGIAPLPDLVGNLGIGINTIDAGSTNDDFGSYGSGTQSASIIGAVGNNGRDLVGANWNLTILPVKVCRYDGSCPTAAIVSGIDWATNNGAQIVQISFTLSASDPSIDAALQRALDAGVIVVAASGNVASSVRYPASYPGVIAVGSTDSSDVVGAASGRGPQLALTAPGVAVPVIVSGGCCLSKSDTSLAAAHVSGCLALMLAAGVQNPVSKVLASTVDLGPAGRDDTYGSGRLDCYAAFVAP